MSSNSAAMKNMPLISIISVCLNEPSLERTCESIVNQTFQNFEWIVIDGGSNDTTLSIFEKYKNRIDYFVSEKDNGIYDAMNKGIRYSHGTWLNFMNAGDSFASLNILEEIRGTLEIRIDMDVLYGEVQYGYKKESMVSYTPKNDLTRHLYFSTIHHQPSFIKRTCFTEYGYYDTSLEVVSDYKFFIVLCKNNAKFLHLNNIIAIMDMDGISNTDKNRIEREMVINDQFSVDEIINFQSYIDPKKLIALRLRRNILSKNSSIS
jgi:glycosyltransferase involved in cell wall biosynthesis